MILCAVTDLMFSSRIATAAKHLDREIAFVRSAGDILTRVRDARPVMVIFDLNQQSLEPITAIGAIKADPELSAIRTIGYVSHVDTATITAARAAGADDVLARSAFTDQLGDILSASGR
jgi:CheY-like chemotaxis protein